MITAVVLAGGRSERFGSDKPLALFKGRPLVAHVVEGLRAAGIQQVLLAAKDPDRYAAAGAELIRDATAAHTPLAGLAAGMRAAHNELVFACAADMPFVADKALIDALVNAAQDCAMPRHAGQLQPLASVWRRSTCLPVADELLRMGSPGPRAVAREVRTAVVDWPDERPFLDADTPEALSALESR